MTIVCTSHNYIYVSGGRCATVSIHDALHSVPGQKQYEPAKITQELWRKYDRHMPARFIKKHVSQLLFDPAFKFTFVRNTYRWVPSLFFFMVKLGMLNRPADGVMKLRDFQQVIAYCKSPAGRRHDDSITIRSQLGFLSDRDGTVLVDFIGRVEHLDDGFLHVCNTIGIKPPKLAHRNSSENASIDWRAHYETPGAIGVVEDSWQNDIDYFGFTLD